MEKLIAQINSPVQVLGRGHFVKDIRNKLRSALRAVTMAHKQNGLGLVFGYILTCAATHRSRCLGAAQSSLTRANPSVIVVKHYERFCFGHVSGFLTRDMLAMGAGPY